METHGEVRLAFDGGTILVTAPAGMDIGHVPGLLWDPRVRAYRAPAWRHRDVTRGLASFDVRCDDRSRAELKPAAEWREVELRPYQQAALLAWELAKRRGVVVLPTGSGKTRLAIAAMARTKLATLCLVPTRVLLEQWIREIGAFFPGRVGCFGDGSHLLEAVTVATFESAYRYMAVVGNRFDLLVIDEAHHFGAGLRDEALEMCTASMRLGLTATPPREPAMDSLGELIGPIVYELAIGDLAGLFLADYDVVTLNLPLTDLERARYEDLIRRFRAVHNAFRLIAPDATWEDFTRAAVRTDEGRRALSAWREARKLLAFTEGKRDAVAILLSRHRDARLLVFTADNQTAYTIAREHLIMPLTCDIARKEREEVLGRFRTGEIRALVSARVLNEGLDVPDADVAIIVGGTLGEREHVQRVGRLLRPRPGKRALIYELVTPQTVEFHQARRRRKGLAARIDARS